MTPDDFRLGLAQTIDVLACMRDDTALHGALDALVQHCVRSLTAGGKIMIAGNGGSAADAQHWAAELVSRFDYDRPGLAAIALTVDTSALTAIGNDYGYDYTFARQIEALGRRGDVFIGLSTSGNSPNVLRALRAARDGGLVTVGFSGRTGGGMPPLCDLLLRVPSDRTPQIQEGHEVLGHLMCAAIERQIFPRDAAAAPRSAA
jgi:D-sedoheptulose 7-phosphate isomerase